jgi:hypothetical protein
MDSNKRAFLIGLENPDGSLNGSLALIDVLEGSRFEPSGDKKDRKVLRQTMSNPGSVIGAKNWDVSLNVELKGGGEIAGVVQPPEMHAALIASGMVSEAANMIALTFATVPYTIGEAVINTTQADEAVGTVSHVVDNGDGTHTVWMRDIQNVPADADVLTGVDSAVTGTIEASGITDALCYRFATDRDDYARCQVHAHYDGVRRVASKAVSSFSFEWMAGEYCTMQFPIKGVYATPSDQAFPAVTYSDLLPPIAESAGLAIEGYDHSAGVVEKISFNVSNEIVAKGDLNSADGRHSFRIRRRSPGGSIDPDALAMADFDIFTQWESGTKGAIHATLGDTLGNRISMVITAAQYVGIKDKERAGDDAYDLSYEATGTNDNEFYLFFH